MAARASANVVELETALPAVVEPRTEESLKQPYGVFAEAIDSIAFLPNPKIARCASWAADKAKSEKRRPEGRPFTIHALLTAVGVDVQDSLPPASSRSTQITTAQ